MTGSANHAAARDDTAPSSEPDGSAGGGARGIRTRITAIAAAAVAIVLAGSAVALLATERRQLTSAVDATLVQRADDLAAVLATGGDVPPLLPATGDDGTVAQIVAADGTVIAASRGLRGALGGGRPAVRGRTAT
jgi:hypothetical protein